MGKKRLLGVVSIVIYGVICLGAASFMLKPKREDTLKFVKEDVTPANM